jgi:hypothetical protein
MSEEKRSFSVSDRRHFTSEGEVRAQAAMDGTLSAAAPESSPAPRSEEEPTLDLVWLFLSLASQAHVCLGTIGPAGSPQAEPDLPGARALIGLLETLSDRTAGRRTPEEDRALASVLCELRLAFVDRTSGDKV